MLSCFRLATSPNVCYIYGLGKDDENGKCFIVMELYDGSVKSMFPNTINKKDLFERLNIAVQAANGIYWLHTYKDIVIFILVAHLQLFIVI